MRAGSQAYPSDRTKTFFFALSESSSIPGVLFSSSSSGKAGTGERSGGGGAGTAFGGIEAAEVVTGEEAGLMVGTSLLSSKVAEDGVSSRLSILGIALSSAAVVVSLILILVLCGKNYCMNFY